MKRRASVAVLLLLVLGLALAASAQAAAPTVETFVIASSTGSLGGVAVDGDLVVWVDLSDVPNGGPSDIWGAVIGQDNVSRTFEIAAAGKNALTDPRVSGTRVVWWSEENPRTGEPAKVWECVVDKAGAQPGAAQLLAEGWVPDIDGTTVVWTGGAQTADSTAIFAASYTRKRTPRRIICQVPGTTSPMTRVRARLSGSLLLWYEEPSGAPSRVVATRPWQTGMPPSIIVEQGLYHQVDGWSVSYGRLNPEYGMMAFDIYAAKVDSTTLAPRTLKLTSARASGDSDVCRDLVVWSGWTRVPGGYGHEIVGDFIDWSGETPVAHEFMIDDSGRFANAPAVTYDALSGRYLVVWETQAPSDPTDNKIMGAWITPAAGGMPTAAAD